MERRQKRQEEGCRKGVELDCEEDEWPRMPPGFRVLTPREQEEQRRKESAISRLDVTQQIQPTATEILQDMHQAANELSSFPPESSDETIGSGDMHESLLHAFDDSSNSPPPCPIVIDTVPDVDDILFPGNS